MLSLVLHTAITELYRVKSDKKTQKINGEPLIITQILSIFSVV
jgi:hypothetical protein